MAKIRSLFNSGGVRIEEFHCRGTHTAHSGEECTTSHEIVFPRRGAFVRYDASGKMLADANHVLFFHRHQPYQISHPLPGGDASVVFGIESTLLLEMLRVYDVSVDDRPDTPFPISHLTVETHQRLQQYRLLQKDDLLEQEEAILVFLGEIIRCTALYEGRRAKSTMTMDAHREIVHQMKIVLGKSFREKLKLADIASAVNGSPFFLCRIFKMETGLTIHQYLQRLRLLNALECLAQHSRADLTELALSLGFASHSHFSTAFLRTFGLPPSEFRASLYPELSKILKV